jgi:hypothetical protein
MYGIPTMLLAVVSRASSRNVSLKGTMQDGTWGMSMNMLPSKVRCCTSGCECHVSASCGLHVCHEDRPASPFPVAEEP